ncbi:glucokinase [Thiotrichales bacterium 19S9-12]|nr:glucokinase [Thiotrichales bacterium 19S9-11]MCF6811739.1 glucokinase [Thiotrichales bacterium 19S9-12]
MLILSGDIGGTNTRLMLAEFKKSTAKKQLSFMSQLNVIFNKTYHSADYKSLNKVIDLFLDDAKAKDKSIYSATFAVAGPIVDGSVQFTNLPWLVKEDELKETLDTDKVKLINDFEAIGYGIETLESKDLHTLQKGHTDPNNLVAVIGAGTGLGITFLYQDGNHPRVQPTEGGHQDFAPVDDEQVQLLQYLRKKLHRVSVERFASGPGLVNIYRYVTDNPLYNQKESPELKRAIYLSDNPAAEIANYAHNHGDPMALRAIDIFIKIYGAVAGNLALTTLPKKGLYIVGGIAPKLLSQLNDGRFINAFCDKGRMDSLVKTIPVHVVLNTDVGIQGATIYASRL